MLAWEMWTTGWLVGTRLARYQVLRSACVWHKYLWATNLFVCVHAGACM